MSSWMIVGIGAIACGGDDDGNDDAAETSAADDFAGPGTAPGDDGGDGTTSGSGEGTGEGSGGGDVTSAGDDASDAMTAADRGECGFSGGPSPVDEQFVEVGTDDATQQPAVRVELREEGTCAEDPPAGVRMVRFDPDTTTIEIVDEDGSVTPAEYMNETYAWPRLDVTATVESVPSGDFVLRDITFTGPGGSASASCNPSSVEQCVVVR